MPMSTVDRQRSARFFAQQAFSKRGLDATAGVHMGQVLAAVVALDTWFDAAPTATAATNQAQMLAALPTAFKNGTNAAQKALILSAVAMGRAGALGAL